MENTGDVWVSPDLRIRKTVLDQGNHGLKPSENSECFIEIPEMEKYRNFKYVIGDSDDNFERLLDVVLTTMHQGEKSEVKFRLTAEKTVNFTVKLSNFDSNGFIYDWDAAKKYNLSSDHKEKGVSLFKEQRYIDASHRFSKAIKLLFSIPIPVDFVPVEAAGIKITEIENLKANLYNNLASCYLKHRTFETVIDLCRKVLKIDGVNRKALYKLGVAYYEVKDYDRSHDTLSLLLKFDPQNKAAVEKLKFVTVKLNEANARVNDMIKKMFV